MLRSTKVKYIEGAIWWSRVGPARIPLFTYLCLITSLVCLCFIHLDVLPQSCTQTTTDCTTSCPHLCVLLLAPPPNLPAVSWLAESGLMVEVCLCVPCPSIKLQSTSPVHISAVHVSSDPHRAGCGPAITHGTNSTPSVCSDTHRQGQGAPGDITVPAEHKAMDSWKRELQWKPFWPNFYRPTNCHGDLEELSRAHSYSEREKGDITNSQNMVWSCNSEAEMDMMSVRDAPSTFLSHKHNSTPLNSTICLWYAIHYRKRSGFSVALKPQCLYPSAPHTVPDLPVSAVLSVSVWLLSGLDCEHLSVLAFVWQG